MADDRFAKEGQIWVCAACGKTHTDQYGLEGQGSSSWDESCMLNAVLCHVDKKCRGDGLLVWWPVDQPLPSSTLTQQAEAKTP